MIKCYEGFKIGEHEYNNMKQAIDFVKFDDGMLLNNEKYTQWIKANGLTSDVHRILYHKTKEGYIVNDTNKATAVLIPNDIISLDYEDFTRKMQQDLKAD